jgi:hypothetical protein
MLGKPVSDWPNRGEAVKHDHHPDEAARDHEINKSGGHGMTEEAAGEVPGIELALGHVLNPGNNELDQKQTPE